MSQRSATLHGTDTRLADNQDVLLLDLDGTVWLGGDLIAHALAVLTELDRAGLRLLYVTNNASRSPEDVAGQLSSGGLHAGAEQVVTSAQAGAALLAGLVPAGSTVLVVGSVALEAEAAARGLRPVRFGDLRSGRLREARADGSDQVTAVLQGFTPDTGWRDLAAASYAIALGAVWVAANVDATLPTAEGLAPGNGSLVAVVATVTGRTPVVAGKPERPLIDTAVARTGARAPLVVGDRLDTDLAAAVGADLPGLLVLTGVSRARDLLSAPPTQRPTYLGTDLRALQLPHHAPRAARSGWVCGRWRAEVVDGTAGVRCEVDHEPAAPAEDGGQAANLALDGLRALAEAVWEVLDATGELPAGIDDALRSLQLGDSFEVTDSPESAPAAVGNAPTQPVPIEPARTLAPR